METLIRQRIDSLIKNPTVKDEKLEKFLRENAREKIATKLIWLVGMMYGLFLIVGSGLVLASKIQFRDLLDLILVLGAMTGLLASAINFYFKE